jgi:hypothetical protein
MDLSTLRGESDQIALIDGQPVPAEIGREYAEFATWWRRRVTDPVEGHLLDYGDKTYLPDRLRSFVLARDGGCRTPGCTTKAASRMQMDHADPYPPGHSSTGNCGCHCTTCHQLKTAGHATRENSKADGSCTWVTVGPTHPRPAPLGAPTRARPTVARRSRSTGTRRPATLLTGSTAPPACPHVTTTARPDPSEIAHHER